MIFGYKGLDKYHTRFMRVLGIPTYLFAITVVWVHAYSPLVNYATFILAPFVYEFVYVNAVFNIQKNSLLPPNGFLWCLKVFVVQVVSIFIISLMIEMFA